MSPPVIAIHGFSHRYGRITAVRDLDLEIEQGCIFGLLGQNGAGKTTTIRALLNLIRPAHGTLSVLGLDSVADALAIRRRIGYVAEAPRFYDWMRVDEILRFCAALHPTWDRDLEQALVKRLGLPTGRRIGALSRGMQAKVGLVTALAPRPDLLLLDDPTSGLDPIVRREFMEQIIGTVQAEGGTVFFSSHLLHEMERVADEVAILHEGRLRLRAPLERLKAEFKRVRATYPGPAPTAVAVPGLVSLEVDGHRLVLSVREINDDILAELRRSGAETVEVVDLPLEEIFVETIRGEAAHA